MPCPCPCCCGACCTGEGCSVTTQAQCAGTWQGFGTTCEPDPCVECSGPCDGENPCPEGCVCVDGQCVTCAPCECQPYPNPCEACPPGAWCCGGCCEFGCFTDQFVDAGGFQLSEPNTQKGAYRMAFDGCGGQPLTPGAPPFPLPNNSIQYMNCGECPDGFVMVTSHVRVYDPGGNVISEVGGICCPAAVSDDPCAAGGCWGQECFGDPDCPEGCYCLGYDPVFTPETPGACNANEFP